jgi:hypothetical protein
VNTAPQPSDAVIVEPPPQRITNPTAVFSGLDKITGRIISFDVAINETVQFGALQMTPRVCYSSPPTETPNTDAFVEVDEVTLQGERDGCLPRVQACMRSSIRSMTCGSPTAKADRAPLSRMHRPKRRSSRRDSNSCSGVHSSRRRSRNVCRRHQDFSRHRDSSQLFPLFPSVVYIW